MASVIAYDTLRIPNNPREITFNSPNYKVGTVAEQLNPNQAPLGSQFKSYELNQATNYWTLDPFQYSITKFDFHFPNGQTNKPGVDSKDFKNDPGLIYHDVNFEKLLSSYTSVKKSVNDFPAQSYHRFQANEGYFNPNESVDNKDLWYYGSDIIAEKNGIAGPAVNVQEINHIIFPEPQRGGLDSRNLTKYSWSNVINKNSKSWEHTSGLEPSINNNKNCEFFNYNSGYNIDRNNQPFESVYNFDSNYCRNIGINNPYEGSMPFNPLNVI